MSTTPAANRKLTRKPVELSAEQIGIAVQRLRLASDESRVKLLVTLSRGDAHVGALCEALGQSQPSVSHHIALLRVSGLIQGTRDGKFIRYKLTELGWATVSAIASLVD